MSGTDYKGVMESQVQTIQGSWRVRSRPYMGRGDSGPDYTWVVESQVQPIQGSWRVRSILYRGPGESGPDFTGITESQRSKTSFETTRATVFPLFFT